MKSLITGAFVFLLYLFVALTRVKAQPQTEEESYEVELDGLKNGTNYEEISALTSQRATTDPESLAACNKPCEAVTDCYCNKLAPEPGSKNVDDYVLRFCTDGQCKYCSKFRKSCSLGANGPSPSKDDIIPCCDAAGVDKGIASEKGNGVDCFYAVSNDRFKCTRPCDSSRYISCTYGDGNMYPDLIACKGKKKNTYIECASDSKSSRPMECGAPGATCKDQPCCKECVCTNGVCVRTCLAKDQSCENGKTFCCKGLCRNHKCTK